MLPKCPYCNEELEYTELCRAKNKGDYYYETWEGQCPKCQKNFYFGKVYNFSYCEILKEIKELE